MVSIPGHLAKVLENAKVATAKGATVFFKFTCANCRSRQTFDVPNLLYEFGKCEGCGAITQLSGGAGNVGFMAVYGLRNSQCG